MSEPQPIRRGSILLASGELDKALLAFHLAVGFQAMGAEMNLWFVMFGTNCIRRPKSRFSPSKWLRRLAGGPGRNPATDTALQRLVVGMNPEGASQIPLSQLQFGGAGPAILRGIFRRKGVAQLEDLIESAKTLGVGFHVCQICVDAMAIQVPEDLVVPATVRGMSELYSDMSASDFRAVL